ncbi:MAG: O-antigen ligase family protein [Prosthecobacter sp.]|nr:O-antigen ligase family protein [Prosthecobacter sp.]
MQAFLLIFFFLGLLVVGTLGTETRLLFFWPGAALLGVAGVLASLKWRLRVLFPPSDLCLLSVLLFAGYIAWRAVTSPVVAFAREDLMILAGCLVVYGLTSTAASHPKWRLGLMAVLLLLVLGNLAVGSIHLSGHWDFNLVPHFFRKTGAGRIGGFFANPNHLAAFLSLALFLSAGWLFLGRGGATLKLWLGFMTVAMAIGMALTVSRGALLGLVGGGVVFAGLLLWVIWQTKRHLFWRLVIGGAVVVGLGGGVLWKANEEYLRTRMDRSPLSNDVRFGIWEAALTQNAVSPVIGTGSRTFYDGSIRYRSPKLPVYAEEALFAHNEYLQMLADYGWVGAVLLAGLVIAHGLNGLRFLRWFVRHKFMQTGRVTSTNLGLCVGALAALVATLIHAVFEFHFHVPATALTGALVLGLLASPGFETGGTEMRSLRLPGVRLLTKLALLAASLTLLAGLWRYGPGDYYLALSQIDQARNDTLAQMGHLTQAIEADPNNPESLYQRGLVRLNGLNADKNLATHPVLKKAVADLEACVALNPSSYLHQLALADGYDAQKRYDEGLGAIRQALLAAPLHEEPRLALGMHWHRLGKFEEAEMAYLWAGQSLAWNEEGTARWIDTYRVMLQHAAIVRGGAGQ